MAKINTVHELYQDGTISLGATRDVSMHFRATMDDGTEKWFYYGTLPPPELTDAVTRPAIHFPADMYDMPEEGDMTFDQAYVVARARAEAEK